MTPDCYKPNDKPTLESRLAAYSAAAGVTLLALAPAADAQDDIVYTDLDPDEVVASGGGEPAVLEIDFDGDGSVDVEIVQDNPDPSFDRSRAFPGENAIAGFGPVTANYDYFYASFLQEGDMISSDLVTTNGAPNRSDFLLASSFYGGLYGDWYDEDAGFLGVEFEADGGTTHYAWVRIDVTEDATSMTVMDYAFNSTPDAAIEAGAGLPVNAEDGPRSGDSRLSAAFPNPFRTDAQVSVEVARTQAVTVEVFDVLGRSVQTLHSGVLSAGADHEFVVDGAELPNGIYIIRASGEDFKDTQTLTLAR